jgi:cell division protein FtsZ
MSEVNDAANIISQAADPEANIIFGATVHEKMGNEIKISVIATGFGDDYSPGLYAPSRNRAFGSFQDFSQLHPTPPPPAAPSIKPQDDTPSDSTQSTPSTPTESEASTTESFDDEFDIPAFLRQKK